MSRALDSTLKFIELDPQGAQREKLTESSDRPIQLNYGYSALIEADGQLVAVEEGVRPVRLPKVGFLSSYLTRQLSGPNDSVIRKALTQTSKRRCQSLHHKSVFFEGLIDEGPCKRKEWGGLRQG